MVQSNSPVAIFIESASKLIPLSPEDAPAIKAICEGAERDAAETTEEQSWGKPHDKRYISADGTKILAITWSDNVDNIDEEDYDAGFDRYAIGDLYSIPEGFDITKLPQENYELDSFNADGFSLDANLTQMLYKSSVPQPSDSRVVSDIAGTPENLFAMTWKEIPCE